MSNEGNGAADRDEIDRIALGQAEQPAEPQPAEPQADQPVDAVPTEGTETSSEGETVTVPEQETATK